MSSYYGEIFPLVWTSVGNNASWSYFGYSMAFGDPNRDGHADLAVGAPYDGYGLAYLYQGTRLGLPTRPTWTTTGNGSGSRPIIGVGQSLAFGDVNGDGYEDLAVGAVGGLADFGSVQLFLGSPTGLSYQPSWLAWATDTTIQSNYGWSVAMGDVNGDGYDDLAVAAP